jgi:hypothetical protein
MFIILYLYEAVNIYVCIYVCMWDSPFNVCGNMRRSTDAMTTLTSPSEWEMRPHTAGSRQSTTPDKKVALDCRDESMCVNYKYVCMYVCMFICMIVCESLNACIYLRMFFKYVCV